MPVLDCNGVHYCPNCDNSIDVTALEKRAEDAEQERDALLKDKERLAFILKTRFVVGEDPSGHFKRFIIGNPLRPWPDSVVADGDTPEDAIDAAMGAETLAALGSPAEHEAAANSAGYTLTKPLSELGRDDDAPRRDMEWDISQRADREDADAG